MVKMPEEIAALCVEREALVAEAHEIDTRARAENRDLTAAELAKIESNLSRSKLLKVQVTAWENEIQPRQTRSVLDTTLMTHTPGTGGRSGGGGGCAYRNLGTSEMVRTLLPSESIAGDVGGDFPIGQFLVAKLTGRDTQAAAPFRTSDVEGGGSMLPEVYSGRLVDLARANSVCIRAGAETMPMTAPEMTIARVVEDATSYWRPEGSSVTASGITFDKVVLRAKTLAAIVPVTLEAMEDISNLPQLIEGTLAAALGVQLDAACLQGIGSESQPQGIYYYDSVNDVTGVGTPTDFAEVSEAVGEIFEANYPGDVADLSWIMAPRDAVTYDGLQDTLNQPLRPTPWVEKLKRFHTTSMDAAGGSAGERWAVVGDFKQMVIGLRTSGVILRILNAGSVTDSDSVTHNATDELKYHIVAHLRADMALLRPTWFTKLEDILA